MTTGPTPITRSISIHLKTRLFTLKMVHQVGEKLLYRKREVLRTSCAGHGLASTQSRPPRRRTIRSPFLIIQRRPNDWTPESQESLRSTKGVVIPRRGLKTSHRSYLQQLQFPLKNPRVVILPFSSYPFSLRFGPAQSALWIRSLGWIGEDQSFTCWIRHG